MKKFLVLASVALLLSATPVLAEEGAAPAAAPEAAASAPAQGGAAKGMTKEEREAKKKEMFEQMKAKRVDALQKKLACVQAATDHKSMKACFPNRGKLGHGKRGGMGHEGGEHEGMDDKPAAAPAPEKH